MHRIILMNKITPIYIKNFPYIMSIDRKNRNRNQNNKDL